MTATTAPIKISAETDARVGHAAHFLGRSKKNIVEEAVAEYIDNHRDEINAGVLEALGQLDGTRESRIAMLADADASDIATLGGLPSTDK